MALKQTEKTKEQFRNDQIQALNDYAATLSIEDLKNIYRKANSQNTSYRWEEAQLLIGMSALSDPALIPLPVLSEFVTDESIESMGRPERAKLWGLIYKDNLYLALVYLDGHFFPDIAYVFAVGSDGNLEPIEPPPQCSASYQPVLD